MLMVYKCFSGVLHQYFFPFFSMRPKLILFIHESSDVKAFLVALSCERKYSGQDSSSNNKLQVQEATKQDREKKTFCSEWKQYFTAGSSTDARTYALFSF